MWAAAKDVAKSTGGSLDSLINNAALVDGIASFKSFAGFSEFLQAAEDLAKDLDESLKVNVHGAIDTVNAFMPLILLGKDKKVITLRTGLGERDFTLQYKIDEQCTYHISNAATAMVVAKFQTVYRNDGVLFLSIMGGQCRVLLPPGIGLH